tara:strand:+ start:323 stop:838 length:516 start_codon:yes stop_codon:yes gene_type:complete
MKKLAIIYIICCGCIFSQERVAELEKIIFEKINTYRTSQGLDPVIWNKKVYDAAYHHALYISERGIDVSHYELRDKENFMELERAQDRIKYYYNERAWGIECIANINFVWHDGDLEQIAEWTVNAWINSPKHRKGLLFDNEGYGKLQYGAVSVLKVTDLCSWARPVLVLVR